MRRILILLGTLLLVFGASMTVAQAADVCGGLDSGKVEVSSDAKSVTVTAPEGKLIDGYCVKAGSSSTGDGAEYVSVDPPQETVVITHSSGKGVSHWSVSYVDDPATTTTQPGDTTTTTDVSGTTITSTTTTDPSSTTTTGDTSTTTSAGSSTTTNPSSSTTTSAEGGGGGGGDDGGDDDVDDTTLETLPLTGFGDLFAAIGFMGGTLMVLGLGVLTAALLARPKARLAVAGVGTHEVWIPVYPRPSLTIHLKLHRIARTG